MINITQYGDDGDRVSEILQRIVTMLDMLLNEDEPGHIDLGQLNLTLEQRAMLSDLLGENGTLAEVFDYGHSRVSATGINGVWLVQHLDGMDQIIDEYIEVNYCPEILIASSEDVRDGRDALKARLFEVKMARKRRQQGK